MTKPPPCLYRSIEGEEAIKNHILGRLWFRSPKYFRNEEGSAADELEGIGSYKWKGINHIDVGDENPIQSVFIMSFSDEAAATKKFGEHYFVIRDPEELKKRVQSKLPPCITEVKWKKIKYTKTTKVEKDLSPSEAWCRKYCSKPKKFSCEREWRLFILFRHSFRLLNDTMKVYVGDLTGIFSLKKHDEAI